MLYSVTHMTHYYSNVLLCILPVGTLSLDGAVGNDEGLGGGNSTYQSIWLGAPGLTDLSLGWWNQSTSTDVSTHWDQQALPDPTPPALLSLSNRPWCRSKELSPALKAVQLAFYPYNAITNEC